MEKKPSLNRALFIISCFLITFSSCKSKGDTSALTKEDSIAIYKAQWDLKERIYYMRLTKSTVESLFRSIQPGGNPNDVKQLHFVWHEYPKNAFGLDTYGADANGNRLTGLVSLEIPDQTRYETNGNNLPRSDLFVDDRGDFKYLFNSTGLGSDTPIQTGKFTEILFIPEMRPFSPTINTMFFSIKKSTGDPGKIFAAGSVIYTNPSPPYNSACLLECDN